MTWLLNKLLALIKALLWNCVCTQYVFRYFNLLHLWSLNIKLTVWCILWVAAVQSNVSLRSKRLIFVKEFIWMIKVIRCLIDVKHVFAECLWFHAKFSFLNFLSKMKTSLLSWPIKFEEALTSWNFDMLCNHQTPWLECRKNHHQWSSVCGTLLPDPHNWSC